MKFRIREMITKDREAVEYIADDAYENFEQMNVCDQITDDFPTRYLVAVATPKSFGPVGFASYAHTEREAIIATLAVMRDFQRDGIGQMLVERIRRKTKKRIEAYVSESNYPVQMFFRKIGFVAIGTDEIGGFPVYRMRLNDSLVWLPSNRITGVTNG